MVDGKGMDPKKKRALWLCVMELLNFSFSPLGKNRRSIIDLLDLFIR